MTDAERASDGCSAPSQVFGLAELREHGAVGVVLFSSSPDNYLDASLLNDIGDALEAADARDPLRAIVLASEGKHFCAGAHLGESSFDPRPIYNAGLRIFRAKKPMIAAVQGSAIGGGLGLALAADFRVAGSTSRFSANFVRLGLHPGFGITASLPQLIGRRAASMLLLSGRRVGAEEALAMGLCDMLVSADSLRASAIALAADIAEGAPLALLAIRSTLRRELLAKLPEQIELEVTEQLRLFATMDFREGIRAVAERRHGNWQCK